MVCPPISRLLFVLAGGVAAGVSLAQAPLDATIYQCPGPVFTNMITGQEAAARGCKVSSKAQAVISVPATRAGPAASAAAGGGGPRPAAAGPTAQPPARPADARVDPAEQRARDSDARRILEAELRKEEERMAALLKDYNGGEPERRGDERNFARYQERVGEMKAALARKESDIAALRRELAKLQ